jgi:hypothetical protein
VVKNNCAHVVHNALVPLHLWRYWPTDRFVVISAFDFPVPKNEFVTLVRLTNDKALARPSALYDEPAPGQEHGRRPGAAPGALVESEKVLQPNELYDTDLRSIFYEFPPFPLHHHFVRFFADERYTDLGANLRWFAKRDRDLLSKDLPTVTKEDHVRFQQLYRAYLSRQADTVDQWLASLPSP